jgi:hypothetical protein
LEESFDEDESNLIDLAADEEAAERVDRLEEEIFKAIAENRDPVLDLQRKKKHGQVTTQESPAAAPAPEAATEQQEESPEPVTPAKVSKISITDSPIRQTESSRRNLAFKGDSAVKSVRKDESSSSNAPTGSKRDRPF